MALAYYKSPIGVLEIISNGAALEAVTFVRESPKKNESKDAVIEMAISQLKEYFTGERVAFSVPIKTSGTEFQEEVWKKLREVPFGRSRKYSEISQACKRNAPRAVGNACKKNPLLIITPCHRVIGGANPLSFLAGEDGKKWLLEHEGIKF